MAESFWKGLEPVEAGLDRVKEHLSAFIQTFPRDFQEELKPLFSRRGKALRAGLMIVAAKQIYSDSFFDCAAALELIHLASLIHDDVVDGAKIRRKEPAFHMSLGIEKAVLYGDFLFAACFRLISREVAPDLAQQLALLVGVMVGAELYQQKDRWKFPLSLRRSLKKTMGKTALLFSLSLYAGAREAKRPEETCLLFKKAGYALGMAFQLQDDLLDWTSTEALIGKPIFEDIKAGIFTLPVVFAWRADKTLMEQKIRLLQVNELSVDAFKLTLKDMKAFEQTQRKIEEYWVRAERDLKKVCEKSELELWMEIIHRLKRRSW